MVETLVQQKADCERLGWIYSLIALENVVPFPRFVCYDRLHLC